jgi:cell division protein ZapA
MERRPVELQIAGQNFRVTSSAPEADLRRLAQAVEAKIGEVAPRGRYPGSQAVLLAAIALAHEVETERARCESLERRTRELLERVLVRIDGALVPLEADESPVEAEADENPGGGA